MRSFRWCSSVLFKNPICHRQRRTFVTLDNPEPDFFESQGFENEDLDSATSTTTTTTPSDSFSETETATPTAKIQKNAAAAVTPASICTPLEKITATRRSLRGSRFYEIDLAANQAFIIPPPSSPPPPRVLYPSVTTVLKATSKSGFTQTGGRIVEKISSTQKKHMQRGTDVHAFMENFLQTSTPPSLTPALMPWQESATLIRQRISDIYLIEGAIFDTARKYAGTVDAVVKMDGVCRLVDWKIKSAPRRDFYDDLLQVSAYFMALHTNYGEKVAHIQEAVLVDVLPSPLPCRFHVLNLQEIERNFRLFENRLKSYHVSALRPAADACWDEEDDS